jgi:putative aldouronate transport system substrate-binding protein
MKKFQKLWALLLALCLLLSMAAGCGSSATTETSDTSSQSEEAAEVSEEAAPAAEDAAAETEEAQPAEESAAPAEEAAEEASEEAAEETSAYAPYTYDLPLTDEDVTFSISMMINPQLSAYYAGYEDNPSWQKYSELTGVNFEFINISAMNMATQYQLMFASQDCPDIMHSALAYYTSGSDSAVDQDVVVDLAPYLEEYAPNYLYWIDKVDGWKNITTDSGYRPGFVHLTDEPSITKSGPVIRGDWLDALGLEAPTTISELHDVLLAMYNEYGGQAEFSSSASAFAGAWDLDITIQTVPTVEYPIYQIDGVVTYGPYTDTMRDYLKEMQSWLDEGILYSEFATRTSSANTIADFGEGTFSYYNADLDALVNQYSYYTTDGAYMTVLPQAVMNEGDVIPFDGYGRSMSALTGQGTFSISTTCPNIELAVQVLDWRYSEEGSQLFNYGIEGISFEYVDGEPQYTDLIVNNPDGLSATWLAAVYMDEYGYVEKYTKFDYQYNEEQLEAREIWSSNTESIYDIPQGVSLTAEESEEYSSLMADIVTYTQECILKFMTGAMSLDDDYDTYKQTLESMGIERCLEIYQDAYDRYLER